MPNQTGKCSICKLTKPAAEFYKSSSAKSGLHGWCKPCSDKRTTENARKRLGVSPEQFLGMLSFQGHKCAICRSDSPGRGKGPKLLGESNPAAKLTKTQVLKIRDSKESGRRLADQYGVSQVLISKIRRRQIWEGA